MTKDLNKDVAAIALKCIGLGFPVFFQRSESGPRVTTHYFTQQIGSSAPLIKVINKAEDIAFACGVESVMITRVKNEIAFQVPLDADQVQIIKFDNCIHDLLTSSITGPKAQQLPLVMGQTVQGENYTIDLADQPHLLIAGSTGAGKSVFQAALVSGLVLAKSPLELQLYLVDTKQLDLPLFKGLAHVSAVVDKIERVHDILDNLILNVRRRTERMKGIARNIAEFNSLQNPHHIMNATPAMKYKVLIIDELADIISLDADLAKTETAQVEMGLLPEKRTRIVNKLQTLTQISRASGIHVIAATQRPSVKLMSGDIKANFPMRLTFRLPTSADSRVILGEGGAENLLGKGDYLYQTYDMASPVRGHGSYVSTTDIARIITQSTQIRESYEQIRAAVRS